MQYPEQKDKRKKWSILHQMVKQYHCCWYQESSRGYDWQISIFSDSFNLTRGDTDSIEDQLAENGLDLTFNKFIDLQLSLPVKRIWIVNGKAQCFRFLVKVQIKSLLFYLQWGCLCIQLIYTNLNHNGKIDYMLNSDVTKLECNGTIITSTGPGIHTHSLFCSTILKSFWYVLDVYSSISLFLLFAPSVLLFSTLISLYHSITDSNYCSGNSCWCFCHHSF